MSYNWFDVGMKEVLNRLKRVEGNTPYQRGGTSVDGSGNYSPLDKNVVQNGTISLSTSALNLSGSNAVTISEAGFTMTWDGGLNVTLYWDGTNGSQVIVQRRSDRTKQVIPPGSITISYAWVSGSTYYGLPFWTPNNRCQIGWVPGKVGTPQIVFTDTTDKDALSQQSYQEREPLSSGYLSFKIPTGAGGGGTGGGCPMLGTMVEGMDGVEYTAEHVKQCDWWRIETKAGGVNVTPNHSFYDENGIRKQAKDFHIDDLITHRNGFLRVTDSYGFLRACTKMNVKVPQNGFYWANGYLSHNSKIAPVLNG